MKIATQSFGLKKEFEQDLTGTIQRLHDMGFTAIEPLILFQKEQGNKTKNLWAQDTLKIAAATMQKCGMTFPSAHIGVGISWFIMPAKNVIEGILNVHPRSAANRCSPRCARCLRRLKAAKRARPWIFPKTGKEEAICFHSDC